MAQEYPHWPNVPAMMFARAREWGGRPLFRAHRGGEWHATDWAGFARQAASVARNLRAGGVAPGDRVMIVSENRPELAIAEIGIMAIRAVPVPAYITNTAADHAHILRDSGARVAIASTRELADRVRDGAALAGGLDRIVVIDAPRSDETPYAVLAGDDRPPDDIAAEAEAIEEDTLAVIIYTSGTGGAPKGVMLPQRALIGTCRGAFTLLLPLDLKDEVYLSFLPMSHVFEQVCGMFFLPSIGTEIVCSRGIEHLAADLRTIRPTIMTVVPRVLEVIRARVFAGVARQPAWKRALFHQALAAGARRQAGASTLLDRTLDRLYDRLVRRKIRDRFGGRFRAAVSGGARLEPEVGKFFLSLGIPVMQGYGQTEGPVISANPPNAIRTETVGPPLDGVTLKIADDGEILVRGDLVMLGYWRQPDVTKAALGRGWLHTGDIGVLDADGYLRITDRKKDMIVLSGGDNISPARIEGLLMAEPEIAQAVIAGEGQAGICALVVPSEGHDDSGAAQAVARVNTRLSVTERVRKHKAVPAFTLENGLLTPTQKIRRPLVLQTHAPALAAMQR